METKQDTWPATSLIPEDMMKEFPVGGILHQKGGARGVVIGYEMKVCFNNKPAWWVVIAHLNDKGLATPSAFSRFWLKNSKVIEVIDFTTPDELYHKAFKNEKDYKWNGN